MVNKEKMSKSLGNFFTLRDVFKTFDPMVIRFYILTHHYRAPLEFSFDDIQAAQKTYQRLCKFFAKDIPECHTYSDVKLKESPLIGKMLAFLEDDMNTSGMWGVVFESLPLLQENEAEFCRRETISQTGAGLSSGTIARKRSGNYP